jgi:murein DD-endopeptidase MepM/ murein hydrolase activator NlpD
MNNTKIIGLPPPGDLRFSSQATGKARLADAAKEFEALLAEAMLRSMRGALDEEEETGEGYGRGIYEEMMYQQLARTISQKPGLGIARMMDLKLAQQEQARQPGASPEGTATTILTVEPVRSSDPSNRLPEVQPAINFHDKAVSPITEPKLSLPVSGHISSGFGARTDPINGHKQFHRGIDFAAPSGTPIKAVEEGRVIFSGKSPQYGNVVVIEHPDQTQTLYAHLAERDVDQGDQVTRQQLIGKVGSTGHSTGPHLHFEVLEQHHNVNPMTRI